MDPEVYPRPTGQEESCCKKGDCYHDYWERCCISIHRCCELHVWEGKLSSSVVWPRYGGALTNSAEKERSSDQLNVCLGSLDSFAEIDTCSDGDAEIMAISGDITEQG